MGKQDVPRPETGMCLVVCNWISASDLLSSDGLELGALGELFVDNVEKAIRETNWEEGRKYALTFTIEDVTGQEP